MFAANGDIRIPKGRAIDGSSIFGDDAACADKGNANGGVEMRAADNIRYSLFANIFIRPLNGAA